MQHKQQYCVRFPRRILALGLGFFALAAAPKPADPILDDGGPSPCQAGADYAAGQDVAGAAVAPADMTGAGAPVPDEVAVPLNQRAQGRRPGPDGGSSRTVGQDSPYVSLDGKKLDPLLNPAPCVNQPGR